MCVIHRKERINLRRTHVSVQIIRVVVMVSILVLCLVGSEVGVIDEAWRRVDEGAGFPRVVGGLGGEDHVAALFGYVTAGPAHVGVECVDSFIDSADGCQLNSC